MVLTKLTHRKIQLNREINARLFPGSTACMKTFSNECAPKQVLIPMTFQHKVSLYTGLGHNSQFSTWRKQWPASKGSQSIKLRMGDKLKYGSVKTIWERRCAWAPGHLDTGSCHTSTELHRQTTWGDSLASTASPHCPQHCTSWGAPTTLCPQGCPQATSDTANPTHSSRGNSAFLFLTPKQPDVALEAIQLSRGS